MLKFPKIIQKHYSGLFHNDSENLLCVVPFSTDKETLLGVKINTISLIFRAVPFNAWDAPHTKSIVLWDCSLSNKSKCKTIVLLSINFFTICAASLKERGSITVTSPDL